MAMLSMANYDLVLVVAQKCLRRWANTKSASCADGKTIRFSSVIKTIREAQTS